MGIAIPLCVIFSIALLAGRCLKVSYTTYNELRNYEIILTTLMSLTFMIFFCNLVNRQRVMYICTLLPNGELKKWEFFRLVPYQFLLIVIVLLIPILQAYEVVLENSPYNYQLIPFLVAACIILPESK
eukprot:Awhi_evm2s5015